MTATIPQRELRNNNTAIIDAVIAGEGFVVTRNGIPVAELRPITGRPRRVFVPRAEIVAGAGTVRIDAAAFRGDLDAAIDPLL